MLHLKNRKLKYYIKLIAYIGHLSYLSVLLFFDIYHRPQFFSRGDFHVFLLVTLIIWRVRNVKV